MIEACNDGGDDHDRITPTRTTLTPTMTTYENEPLEDSGRVSQAAERKKSVKKEGEKTVFDFFFFYASAPEECPHKIRGRKTPGRRRGGSRGHPASSTFVSTRLLLPTLLNHIKIIQLFRRRLLYDIKVMYKSMVGREVIS